MRSGDLSGDELQLIITDSDLRPEAGMWCWMAEDRTTTVLGRRERLAECATSAAMRSSFPPDELHLHVFGQRRQTSCQSAECSLASAQHERHQYLLRSSCCVPEVVCLIVTGVILSPTSTDTFVRVLHILPIISPLLHTQQTYYAATDTVHAPRQTLTIPRPSYPCSPRAPASLVRLHPLVHHTHYPPPPI